MDTPISEIISLIMSEKLLMLRSSYNELHFLYNPERNRVQLENQLPNALIKSYEQQKTENLQQIMQVESTAERSLLTCNYDSTEIPEGSLAFHQIVGPIISDSRWWFSTMQFERDIIAAEANPQICAHFILLKSPGGDAYYLDEVSRTLRSCKKPIYAFVRQICASAAYYIACHATVIKANTVNDIIGSIGTKVSFLDWESYYAKEGLKRVEVYASNSKLKDKKFNDLIEGKHKKFIEDELDPLNNQFMNEVKSCRPVIGSMGFDNPVLQGETFRAELALTDQCGLIDGITSLDTAISEATALAQKFLKKRNESRQGITKYL